MIFFFNENGDRLRSVPTRVYQGSNNASKVYFVAPFPIGATVQMAAIKPNGDRSRLTTLTLYTGDISGIAGIQTPSGAFFNVWFCEIPDALTTYSGDLRLQFFITIAEGATVASRIATEYSDITIEKGVAPIIDPAEVDSYDDLLGAFTAFTTYWTDIYNDISSVVYNITDNNIYIRTLNAGIYKLISQNAKKIYYADIQDSTYVNVGNNPVLLLISQHTEEDVTYNDYIFFRSPSPDELAPTDKPFILYCGRTVKSEETSYGWLNEFDLLEFQKTGNRVNILSVDVMNIKSKIPSNTNSTDNKLVNHSGMIAYALPLSTKYTANIAVSFNSTTAELTVQLKDQDGNNIGNARTVTLGELADIPTIKNNITAINGDITAINGDITAINGKIPTEASNANKLADKAWTAQLIAENAANFLGTFSNVPSLIGYSGTKTNNDYANVRNSIHNYSSRDAMNAANKANLTNWDYAKVHETFLGYSWHYYHFDIVNQEWVAIDYRSNTDSYNGYLTYYNRYTYNATSHNWTWNFSFSDINLTTAQIDALNSGITAAKVAEINQKVNKTTTIAGVQLSGNISDSALLTALGLEFENVNI